MESRRLEIVNRRGLHARAAARLVKEAAKFKADILVSRDGTEVSGLSIVGLMMLAAAQGTHIDLQADGPEAGAALDALEKLVAARFEEEE